jgi:hypothetical protein
MPLLPAPPAPDSTRCGKLPYTNQTRVEYLRHIIPTQMSLIHYNNITCHKTCHKTCHQKNGT